MSLKKLLLKREEQIRKGAEIAARETNDFLAVKEYIVNRTRELDQLNERQIKTLDMYKFAYSQYMTGKFSHHEIVTLVSKFFDVSVPTSNKHVADAIELFGTVYRIDKQFEIKLQLEMNRKMLVKASNINLDSYARLEKNRLDLLKELQEEEKQQEEFKGHTIVADINPELLGLPIPTQQEIDVLLDDIERKYGKEIDLEFVEIEKDDDGESE